MVHELVADVLQSAEQSGPRLIVIMTGKREICSLDAFVWLSSQKGHPSGDNVEMESRPPSAHYQRLH